MTASCKHSSFSRFQSRAAASEHTVRSYEPELLRQLILPYSFSRRLTLGGLQSGFILQIVKREVIVVSETFSDEANPTNHFPFWTRSKHANVLFLVPFAEFGFAILRNNLPYKGAKAHLPQPQTMDDCDRSLGPSRSSKISRKAQYSRLSRATAHARTATSLLRLQ